MKDSQGEKKSFEDRLNRFPWLKERVGALMDVMENREGAFNRADHVERLFFNSLRELGPALLEDWAALREEEMQRSCKNQGIRNKGKKN